MIEKLTFHNHPLKSEIIERWEKGQTSQHICEWLKLSHSDVSLSQPTLAKHYKRFRDNKRRLESSEKKVSLNKKEISPIEDILWETIDQCRQMKKRKTISVKDWQYLDQQCQSALEKLIRVADTSGGTRDISSVLSDIFSKLELGESIDLDKPKDSETSDIEKIKIAQDVDNENKSEG